MAIPIPKPLRPFIQPIIALCAGMIFPFGFAPFNYAVSCFASIIIFLYLLHNKKPKASFFLGWLYGIGLFAVGSSWVYISIHIYGETPIWLAGILTSLFVIALGLFYGMVGLLTAYLVPNTNLIRTLIGFPIIWVILEIFRGWFLTGFPWLYAGYSQLSTNLQALAPIGSVWAVSWAVLLTSGILFHFMFYYQNKATSPRVRNILFITFVTLWMGCYALKYNWITPSSTLCDSDKSLQVALLQSNTPQEYKWQSEHRQDIVNQLSLLTTTAMQNKADLIVWPEAAMPVPLPYSGNYFSTLGIEAKSQNIGVIASAPIEVNIGEPPRQAYTNALFGLGTASGIYHKQHLVPFGEYVPFENWLRGLIKFFDLPMSNMTAIPNDEKNQLIMGNWRVAPAICYEIAYPILVRERVKANTDFILTVSNDTWFGASIGPYQHMQIAQMRALETGRYLLRATNTGFTAIVAPQGNIIAMAPQYQPFILSGKILRCESQTLWMRFGIGPLFILLGLGLLFAFYFDNKLKKK
jgi:apolipoprotein N-acyltransferase